jgi:hypothetical protein
MALWHMGLGLGLKHLFGGFRWLSAHTANWMIFMCFVFIFQECIVVCSRVCPVAHVPVTVT